MTNAARCIDDFLIYPTTPSPDHGIGVALTHEGNDHDAKLTAESLRSEKWKSIDFATNMLHSLAERPLLEHQYNSDEEMASPMDRKDDTEEDDDDSADQDSFDDSVSTFSDLASLSESLNDTWDESDSDDYINAETISFIQVGKPKVVSLPPSPTSPGYFDVPVPPHSASAPSPTWRDENFFAYRLTNVPDFPEVAPEQSVDASLSSAHVDHTGTSIVHSQVDVHHSRQRSASLSVDTTHNKQFLLSAVPTRKHSIMVPSRSTSKQSADAPSPRDTSSLKPFNSLRGSSLRPSLSLRKLSPGLFSRFTKNSDAGVQQLSPPKELPVVPETTPVAAPLASPSSRPKMVARDANERAKPIILPPCPSSYEPAVESIDVWNLARQSSMSSRKVHDGRLRHGL